MASKMQLKIVSREHVKPSCSIPNNHPPSHNLSFFDQLVPSFYLPLVFFYKSQDGETDNRNRSSVLKCSLSTILTHYYPLAGRLQDNFAHNCNDEGVVFLEAASEHDLSEVLSSYDDEILKALIPDGLSCKDSFLKSPVAIQVSYFKCGGMSIGLCICHKMLDMESTSSFISDWASLARDSSQEISLEFDIQSFFPPVDLPFLQRKPQAPPEMAGCVLKRLVFDGSNITKLKAMVEQQVPNPTRVEVVSSLLHKSALSAASKASSSGSFKPSLMAHAINLRTRVSPPLSTRNKGNLSWFFPVCTQEDGDVEFEELVKNFRRSKEEFSSRCAASNIEELSSMILKSMKPEFKAEYEAYFCTSWCRYPFYETDFGWGKPLWVATPWAKKKNTIILIDTRGNDGIEAYVVLEEKVMAIFENDEELLSFACLNPKPIRGLE